ncbi:energy-coupling factor transporter transmembrane component T [Leucobacter sp. M11]|uniref:energy-coupling factor transporter transmembrane component T n=1 Tax=Leucobacter sp. M11 TaxID=2993565 RepID=UPI002D7E63C3|nr:energy-coupling factor transporter transmembrane component T [Leucobacter sp. M11]MEB4614925.1 energy-coupling factor transporter transmembrane component T [Leucobacter sp. M11]
MRDPRITLVLVIATGVVMSLPAPEPFFPGAVLLVIMLIGIERAWRRLAGFLIAIAGLAALASLLPALVPHASTAIIGYTAAYLLRFVLIAAVASHVIATTSAAHLTAAFRAAGMPRAIVVPTAVTMRFLPVVATETRAVWEAMQLRGLASTGDMLRHPVRLIEWLTVPVIASTLRVGDDLTASALLRGLGSTSRPTSIHPTRISPADVLLLAMSGVLAALSWWLFG